MIVTETTLLKTRISLWKDLLIFTRHVQGPPEKTGRSNGIIVLSNRFIKTLTLSGPEGGGQYCHPDLWQAPQQKLEKPVTWIFLTIPKYVQTLTLKKIYVNPDRLAERGAKSAGQDLLTYWTYLHFLWCIISISSC